MNKDLSFRQLIRNILPQNNISRLKYSNGLIGIIGGSAEYSGAPYFSAVSSVKSGADMSHIFCHKDACLPLKTYSPEYVVHNGFGDDPNDVETLDKTARWFKSMTCLIYGPGLGREKYVIPTMNYLVAKSSKINNLVHIFDADGLHAIINNYDHFSEILKETPCIFTPNRNEFNYFFKFALERSHNNNSVPQNTKECKLSESDYDKVIEEFYFKGMDDDFILIDDFDKNSSDYIFAEREVFLSRFTKQIILRKGLIDIITDGKVVILVGTEGSPKRCGGIGDILDGVLAAYVSLMKNNEEEISRDSLLKCCAAACYFTKYAATRSFEKANLSLTACDILKEIPSCLTEKY